MAIEQTFGQDNKVLIEIGQLQEQVDMHLSDVFCLHLSGRTRKHIKDLLLFLSEEIPVFLDLSHLKATQYRLYVYIFILHSLPLPEEYTIRFLRNLLYEFYSLKKKLQMDFYAINPTLGVTLMSQMHLYQPWQARMPLEGMRINDQEHWELICRVL